MSKDGVLITLAGTGLAILLLAGTVLAILLLGYHLQNKKKKNSSNDIDRGHDENQFSRPSPPIASSPCQDYEVFLSFRGEDTRYTFTDHLYGRLVDAGIRVFRDSEELHVGETIGPGLIRAIRCSTISIPIISLNYASSKWCLNELLQICKCMKNSGQLVLPIFYQVEPSDVRNLTGKFGKALWLCKKKYGIDDEVVKEWKLALVEVASLKGWKSNETENRHEGQLVKMVVARVCNELMKASLVVPDFLVGTEDHVKAIMEMLDAKPSNDVKMIVIYGMGGIGKTTLGKALYNRLGVRFINFSFIANIHETSRAKGVEDLQKQLITDILGQKWPQEISNIDEGIAILRIRFKRKKVLVLLDDVDHVDQVKALAAKPDWFGPGSILIVTSRRRDLLEKWPGSLSYELNGLTPRQSFLLFCNYALGASVPREFEAVSKEIVSLANGLPLALEVIGSCLYRKHMATWKYTLNYLKEKPHDDVQKKLRISYDGLNYDEQQIFLDIACLSLQQYPRKNAFYMWDACGYYPQQRIHNPVSMSLIKIGETKELIIHDQLKILGREIVRQDSKGDLGKRSRLWNEEEAWSVLESKQGTKKIQVVNLIRPRCHEAYCTNKQFERMTNLRFLGMRGVHLVGDFKDLLLNLRWLEWTRCPSNFMATNFHPLNLVVLNLSSSEISENWKGWSYIEFARNLKVLRLEDCNNLTTTPAFSGFKELETLTLARCKNLTEVHPSICLMSKTLHTLDLRYCAKLEELPNELGKMEGLRELLIQGTNIGEIPISEGFMTKLRTLSPKNCRKLLCISDSIGSLVQLQGLSLKGCVSLTKIPETIGNLKSLFELGLACTGVKELPDPIGDLQNLQKLDLKGCKELVSLRNLPSSLTSLKFNGDSMKMLPDVSYLINLQELEYRDIFEKRNGALNLAMLNKLKTMKILHSKTDKLGCHKEETGSSCHHFEHEKFELCLDLPSSLAELRVNVCQTLRRLPNLSELKNLSKLCLYNCSGLMEINGIEGAESLTSLHVEKCKRLSKLSGIAYNLNPQSCNADEPQKNLKEIKVCWCEDLVEISGLNNLVGIQSLTVDNCSSLERISDLSHMKMLRWLSITNCQNLSDVEGIHNLTSLICLRLYECNLKRKLLDLSMLRNLTLLKIKDAKFTDIPGLQQLKSLRQLTLQGCKSLEALPDFSQFTQLRSLRVSGCEKIEEIRGLNSKFLRYLAIHGCPLRVLPNLSEKYIHTGEHD